MDEILMAIADEMIAATKAYRVDCDDPGGRGSDSYDDDISRGRQRIEVLRQCRDAIECFLAGGDVAEGKELAKLKKIDLCLQHHVRQTEYAFAVALRYQVELAKREYNDPPMPETA